MRVLPHRETGIRSVPEVLIIHYLQPFCLVQDRLAVTKLRPEAAYIPTYKEGYAATVLAIKANEAITKGGRIELKKEWFELS